MRARTASHADVPHAGQVGIRLRLHPLSTVMAGPIFYAVEDAPAVMKAYEQFITTAPES